MCRDNTAIGGQQLQEQIERVLTCAQDLIVTVDHEGVCVQ